MSSIFFVTCLLNIYEDKFYDERNIEWRIAKFAEIASTGISIILHFSADYFAILHKLVFDIFPNVMIGRVLSIQDTQAYIKYASNIASVHLPIFRNEKKDTFEYLCLMNSKTEFMGDAIRQRIRQRIKKQVHEKYV